MASRKSGQNPRAAARKPPSVRARNAPRPRQASRRGLAVAGGIVLVLAAFVAVVAANRGNSSPIGPLPTKGSLVNALPGAGAVGSLFKNIPQQGLRLGSPSAPVTLVEYIDLQCPYCRAFETQVMPQIVQRYVRTGKVKIEARVLAFIGPDSSRGRDAMIAAGDRGKAFDFAQILYDNQQVENTGWLSDRMVARAAESIPGVNPRRLFTERTSPAVKREAAAIDQEGSAADVNATPTLFVGRSGTTPTVVPLRSPTDAGTLVAALNAALAR
jgi:protein-disulfide isomerase